MDFGEHELEFGYDILCNRSLQPPKALVSRLSWAVSAIEFLTRLKKSKIEHQKNYSEACPYLGLSFGTTLGPI